MGLENRTDITVNKSSKSCLIIVSFTRKKNSPAEPTELFKGCLQGDVKSAAQFANISSCIYIECEATMRKSL